MKVPAYLPRRGKAAAEVLGYHRRLKGTQPYAHMGRGLGDRLYYVRKPRLSRQVYAVGRDLYPRQHDLSVALSVELRRLRGGILKRAIGMVVGAFAFRLVYTIALRLDMPAFMLKLVSSVIVVLAIATPYFKKQLPMLRRRMAARKEAR